MDVRKKKHNKYTNCLAQFDVENGSILAIATVALVTAPTTTSTILITEKNIYEEETMRDELPTENTASKIVFIII